MSWLDVFTAYLYGLKAIAIVVAIVSFLPKPKKKATPRKSALTKECDALADKLPKVADHLENARPDLLAFTAFPKQIWRQIWSNNPQERLNKEIRRRTDVVGIFPDRDALIRLVGAVLAEQHDEWAESRRYLGLDVLSKSRTVNDTPTEQEATPAALTA